MPKLRAGVRYCKREPNFFVVTEALYWLYIQFMTQIKPPQCQMYGSSSTDLDSFFIYLYGGGVAWHHSELSWQELLEASILLEIEIADPSSMTGLAPVICNCVLVDGWCFIYNAGIIIKLLLLLLLLLTDDAGKKWTVIIILCNGTRSLQRWGKHSFLNTFKSIDKCVAQVFHLSPCHQVSQCWKITPDVVFDFFQLCHFPSIFLIIKLPCNTVWPPASGFPNSSQWTILGIWKEILAVQKCQPSSLRSPCWMIFFRWNSNTVKCCHSKALGPTTSELLLLPLRGERPTKNDGVR